MKIAITGASGQLGRLVIERLCAKVPVSDIVALVRTPSKATDLGVAVREATPGPIPWIRPSRASIRS